jgi:hypothetical protein
MLGILLLAYFACFCCFRQWMELHSLSLGIGGWTACGWYTNSIADQECRRSVVGALAACIPSPAMQQPTFSACQSWTAFVDDGNGRQGSVDESRVRLKGGITRPETNDRLLIVG